MKFNPLDIFIDILDIFIDITQGYDILWTAHKKLAIGLVALALGLMVWGLLTAALWPFVAGCAVCGGSTAAAYVIGRES